jgi:hypothetical protein
MFPVPGLYKYLGGAVVVAVALGLVWGHGYKTCSKRRADQLAEAKAQTVIVAQQRDQARRETAECYEEVVAPLEHAVAEWKRAAESYRKELTSALSTPPKTVYRTVEIESMDCADAVVEVAEKIAEALE